LSSLVTALPPKSTEADKERPLYEEKANARAEAAPPRCRAASRAAEAGRPLLRTRKEAEDRRRSMRVREPRRRLDRALLGQKHTLMRLSFTKKKSLGLIECVRFSYVRRRMRLGSIVEYNAMERFLL